MDLVAMDQATAQVASAVYSAVPSMDWREVIATFLIPPHGESMAGRFAFVLQDGKVDQATSPLAEFEGRSMDLARAHWKLVQQLGQPRWYGMTVRVARSGQFRVQFEYNDNYQIGDMSKPRPAPEPSDLSGLK